MEVTNVNEEVENMLYYTGSSKAVRMPSKGRSTKRALGWVERTNKILTVACCSPLDRGFLCFGRADLLTLLRCFSHSSSAWGYLLSFIQSFNVFNVARNVQ